MKRVALALLLTLPLGAFATEEDDVIEEVIVIGNPDLIQTEEQAYLKHYREVCNRQFFDGKYKNTVWIRGLPPGLYCHRYAQALIKNDFDVS
tara:strand:+ start:100 stop:375 length:276 start_codon:yes stop_codon:yes gene_type:complete